MKKLRTILLFTALFLCGAMVSAQTADEIISKYLQATGGKELISKIKSLYYEGTINVMGNDGVLKMTTLNGKGNKMEMDMMGSLVTNCVNEKEGWMINPFMGGSTAETMPEPQYKAGRDQIFIGSPFLTYSENGYKAELLGNETIDNINAQKIKLTSPDNTTVTYYFDPATGYLIRSVQQAEMQGQTIDNVMNYSDYQETDGYIQPHKMVINMGGQFEMVMTIKKVEINKPVEEAIFAKP